MLAAMFAAFILQIVFRYLLNLPIGWTHELSVILWLWLVLWGAAFVVSEREEIRFDIIYGAGRARGPAASMCILTAVALVALYVVSLPAVVDYVTFMKVERTAYLKIRFDWLFSIYIVFRRRRRSSATSGSPGRPCAAWRRRRSIPTKASSGV